MKKFWSLLRATTKGDLNVFRFKKSGKGGIALMLFLALDMCFVSYFYSDMLIKPLHEIGLSYITLTIFSLVVAIIVLMETMYKAQGILFEAKDNNLLFSMPIKRWNILLVRTLKILIFDYIFEFMFLVPCFLRYAILIKPGISFYLISIVFFILLPLIPYVIGLIIAYVIRAISSKFKKKILMQTILSLLIFVGIYYISFNLEGFINNIAQKAQGINDFITRLYLPIGLYIDLIIHFDFLKFMELLLISIVPFTIFVLIFEKGYSHIINQTKEISSKSKKQKENVIKQNKVIKTLMIKEIKNYFSIPSYLINTIISPLLALAIGVVVLFKFDGLINTISNEGISINTINNYLPLIMMGIIIVLCSLASITASSISLEGKKLDLLKSMPIKVKDIILSKLLLNDIILIPAMIISSIIFIIKVKLFNIYALFIIFTAIAIPHLNGQIGLLANLKFPHLDFNSPVEVVKQSIAVLVHIMTNMLLSVLLFLVFYYTKNFINLKLFLTIFVFVIILIIFILNKILTSYGEKRFKEIA